VKGLSLDHVEVRYAKDEQRPPFFLHDVTNADFDHVKAPHAADVPTFVLKDVNGFVVLNSPGVPDTRRDQRVANEKF
jgi:hypothetical protein